MSSENKYMIVIPWAARDNPS